MYNFYFAEIKLDTKKFFQSQTKDFGVSGHCSGPLGLHVSTSDTSLGVFDKLTLTETECPTQLVKYTKWGAWSEKCDFPAKKRKKKPKTRHLFHSNHKPHIFSQDVTCRRAQDAAISSIHPSQWWHTAQDNSFDHWASMQQRGSQNKEDNCKASSQEICGNKVSTCHSCEMPLKVLRLSGFEIMVCWDIFNSFMASHHSVDRVKFWKHFTMQNLIAFSLLCVTCFLSKIVVWCFWGFPLAKSENIFLPFCLQAENSLFALVCNFLISLWVNATWVTRQTSPPPLQLDPIWAAEQAAAHPTPWKAAAKRRGGSKPEFNNNKNIYIYCAAPRQLQMEKQEWRLFLFKKEAFKEDDIHIWMSPQAGGFFVCVRLRNWRKMTLFIQKKKKRKNSHHVTNAAFLVAQEFLYVEMPSAMRLLFRGISSLPSRSQMLHFDKANSFTDALSSLQTFSHFPPF